MAATRELACVYYAHEGGCLKGMDGTFWKSCQICKKYTPRGGPPARKNLKKQKMEKIIKRDIKQIMKNY